MSKMATACSGVLLLVLVLGCYYGRSDLADFSRAIRAMTNDTLGVGKMQGHFASISYTKHKKSVSAEQVATQISRTFSVQQSALQKIKESVEQLYRNRFFTDRDEITECCNVVNLTESYEFGLPISKEQSCDRISGIASKNAASLYSRLDSTFEDNHEFPLKWQYFGSEKGILNQYPSSKPTDCSSYDNRFRPWYKASATPNPKDVVIVIKNNQFPNKAHLFEAADIILRTLNPRDRFALVIYNEDIFKNMIGGCHATNLSLATPANVNLFQSFLKTAPDARSGNRMSLALEAAYKYYDFDIDENELWNITEHPEVHDLNITIDRERAIIFLTDGSRIPPDEQERTMDVLEKYCTRLAMVSIFILVSSDQVSLVTEVQSFFQYIVNAAFQGTSENLIQLDTTGDLRKSITNFYAKFAAQAQHSSNFKPVFMVPYYDVFGLEQLVMTLSTPCYSDQYEGKRELLGVASVDLKVSDMFASAEHFTQGDLSYAFVIDQDGLVLLHPLLPFPSSTSAAVYLDISTLEPQPKFSSIRQSMISGGSGSKILESQAMSPRGHSEPLSVMSNYSWAPIMDTPFSLCVVVPKYSYECEHREGFYTPPIKAHYHMLDVLADKADLCRQVVQYATPNYSTVALFPESFEQYSLKHGKELETESRYLQGVLTSLEDPKQILKTGVLEKVAATAKAEEVWMQLDGNRGNGNHGDGNHADNIHDYVAWRYIANSVGMIRIYPGTQVETSCRKASRYSWYQNAVSDTNAVAISPPHKDYLGTGHTVSLSKAIVRDCLPDSEDAEGEWLMCGIEAVMGMDIAHGYFWTLFTNTVETCNSPEHRCILIDNDAYVIAHPRFFTEPNTIDSYHLSTFEPFLMRDMYLSGYVKRVYCNNFQYNYEFTKRPRKQFTYKVADEVKQATEPVVGGYLTRCVFYTIIPVPGTNMFFIDVDVERSSKPLCTEVSCPCNPGQPCSNLPGDCTCPCVEKLPPENYNSCLESFTGLSAHACPTRASFPDQSVQLLPIFTNATVEACYPQNCTEKNTSLQCLSSVSCELCHSVLDNGTSSFECQEMGYIRTQELVATPLATEEPETFPDALLMWQGLSGVLMLLLVLTLLSFMIYYVKEKTAATKRRKHIRVEKAMASVTTTDSSVENSLKRQSSQESSQEGLTVSSVNGQKTISSIVTFNTILTAGESGVCPLGGGQEGHSATAGDEDGLKGITEERVIEMGRGEGEGTCTDDGLLRPNKPFETDQKASSSFPDSLGTNGLRDMLSKLGESPDPSKAGGIWF